LSSLLQENKKIFIVTSQLEKVKKHFTEARGTNASFNNIQYLTCDATVMKTVARVNPTLYLMNGPIVKQKWGWNNFNKVLTSK
jgi:hypothetical protein